MAERRLIVASEVGLHARPAATFVQIATKSDDEITVAKVDGEPVNAKSILSVLGLDVKNGDEIVLVSRDEATLDLLTEVVAGV